ncbi:MAG TPA: alpha-ketoglutarate-dependent dioxygenase AlkB [Gemmatimonadaceae bacterium]
MSPDQLSFFAAPGPTLPEGFLYRAEVITPAEERALLERIPSLPLREFEFHGFTGRRRTVSYGWRYDFADERLWKTEDMPEFLVGLREKAAAFAGIAATELQQVLVTEYAEGAGIGWHRDKAVFGDVVGISLLSDCTFRLRRKTGEKWERVNLTAEPRSAYLLRGPSRTEWEHSIPGVDALRYSITFRNLRER